MMSRKKRAYLITLAILAALGGVSYYVNSQTKQYELNLETQNQTGLRKEPTPAPTPSPIPAPVPIPTPSPTPVPVPRSTEKSKTFIIEVDQYTTKTPVVTVPKDYKVDLVMKVNKYRSGDGLSFIALDGTTTFVKAGETKTLSFKPESDFIVTVFLGETQQKAPYNIQVNIE